MSSSSHDLNVLAEEEEESKNEMTKKIRKNPLMMKMMVTLKARMRVRRLSLYCKVTYT